MKSKTDNKKIHFIFIIFVLITALFFSCKKANGVIVILMEHNKEGVTYKIGPQNFSTDSLYDYLSKSIIKNRDNNSAIIIANEVISIADIINTRGMLEKIGFQNIRYFYYGDGKRMMAEFSFNKTAIPFSIDPKAI